jgi:DHA3 family tetracycline resistance protein-like MFS transporter
MVVPAPELIAANSLKEVTETAGRWLAGPALGGAIVGAAGVGAAFAVDAVSCAVSTASLVMMASARVAADAPCAPRLRAQIAEAVAFVRGQTWLTASIGCAAVQMLVTYGPLMLLVPLIVKNDLGGDAATLGVVWAANGTGSLVAATAFSRARLPSRRNAIALAFGSWTIAVGLVAAIALPGSAPGLCLVMAGMGAAATVGAIVFNTLMQVTVPPALLGRVSSLDWLVSLALIPVSMALTGPVVDEVGVDATLIGGGLIAAAVTAGTFLALPVLWRAPRPAEAAPAPPQLSERFFFLRIFQRN